MAYDIKREGDYELRRIDKEHHILVLDDDRYSMVHDYFTVSESSQGRLQLQPDPDENGELVRSGEYRLIHFRDDPKFQDVPYLFVEEDDGLREVFLPDGLPDWDEERAKYLYTERTIDVDDLDAHLEVERHGRVDAAVPGASDPPVEEYFEMSADELIERIRQMQPAELRDLEEYEQRFRNREEVLETIRRRYRA